MAPPKGTSCPQTQPTSHTPPLAPLPLPSPLTPQVVDDILDITATTEELGKTAGKDLASAKTTYPSLVGLERSREVRVGACMRPVSRT